MSDKIVKFKPLVNILIITSCLFIIFANDSTRGNIFWPFLKYSLNKISIFGLVITFGLISFINNGKEEYPYKLIIFSLFSLIVSSFIKLGNSTLFLPLLIVFFESKNFNKKRTKLLILASWLSFLLQENVNYEGINNIIFFLIASSFCIFFNEVLKENKNLIVISYPLLLLHIGSIQYIGSVNKYVLLSFVILYIYMFFIKILSEKKHTNVLFLTPALFYISIIFWGPGFNHSIFLPYLIFLTIALKSYGGLNKVGRSLIGSLYILMFSSNYFLPNMVLIEGFKHSNFIVAYHLIQLFINFTVGYCLGENLKNLIEFKDRLKEEIIKNDLKNNAFILITGLFLFYSIFNLQTVVQLDSKPFQDKLLAYILTFLSLLIGVMFRNISENSLVIKTFLERIYFLTKRIYVRREHKLIVLNDLDARVKQIDLREVHYLFSNIDDNIKYKLTIILSLLFIVLTFLVVVK